MHAATFRLGRPCLELEPGPRGAPMSVMGSPSGECGIRQQINNLPPGIHRLDTPKRIPNDVSGVLQ